MLTNFCAMLLMLFNARHYSACLSMSLIIHLLDYVPVLTHTLSRFTSHRDILDILVLSAVIDLTI